MESSGSFAQLEIKVKQWVQKTKTEESVERPVTRTMLKEIYHWDELVAQCKLFGFGCTCNAILMCHSSASCFPGR